MSVPVSWVQATGEWKALAPAPRASDAFMVLEQPGNEWVSSITNSMHQTGLSYNIKTNSWIEGNRIPQLPPAHRQASAPVTIMAP